MILTDKGLEEFEEASRPLAKWLNENCHPHVMVVVTASSSELMEGIANVLHDCGLDTGIVSQ